MSNLEVPTYFIIPDEDQYYCLTGSLDEQFSFQFINGEKWDLLGDDELVIDMLAETREENAHYIGWTAEEFLLWGHSPLIDDLCGYNNLLYKED